MRAVAVLYRISAIVLLIGLMGVLVCSGMTAFNTASSAPAGCPLHSHHSTQIPACCSAGQRTEALTEAELQLPDLALQGVAIFVPVGVAVPLPAAAMPVDGMAPHPPSLLPLRI